MKVVLTSPYKSLTPFEWDNIPPFAVITGPNGSGKSQFLAVLKESLSLNSNICNIYLDNKLVRHKESDVFLLEPDSQNNLYASRSFSIAQAQNYIEAKYTEMKRNAVSAEDREILNEISIKLHKPANQLSKDEILENIPVYFGFNALNIFASEIPQMFMNYRLILIDGREKGLSDQEIAEAYGTPPWTVFQDVILAADLDYRLILPTEVSIKSNYELLFRHKLTNSVVPFSDFSSGEKALFTLAFWMFHLKEHGRFPKILLLDEPDAHLHPSMAKQYIDVLKDVFVEKYGLRIIMTTHSPATVSFAPEESLFEMKANPTSISQVSSKQRAINVLTNGLVRISTNSKFVLVEDQADVEFYNSAYSICMKYGLIDQNISINFISASTKDKSGGKDAVNHWVVKLQTSGLNEILFGIIDKDYGNPSGMGIFVLNRYSIENYWVDPLVIYAVIIDDGLTELVHSDFKHLSTGDEKRLLLMNASELQKICNHVFNLLEPLIKSSSNINVTQNRRKVRFSNIDVELEYPEWILDGRGKDLIEPIRVLLKTITFKEKLIKATRKLELVPDDLVQVFRDIQNA